MAAQIGFAVRSATADDLQHVAALLRAYMLETYSRDWSGSENALRRDAFGVRCDLELAVSGENEVIGFAAWKESYDLHHCVSGGDVLDIYVVPVWRGRAVAVRLVCAVAAAVKDRGGKYLQGSGPEGGRSRRLYDRIAVAFPGATCIVGGRAFRRLAELNGAAPKTIVRSLPPKAWNHET